MSKKNFVITIFCVMLLSTVCMFFSACNTESEENILNIYSFNDEFQRRLTSFYPNYNDETKMIGDTKVVWHIVPADLNQYQETLDKGFLLQKDAMANDKIDIFLVEADYAKKYTTMHAGVALSVSEVGLTEYDLRNQFQYTKDFVSDENGIQMATSWQATPGVLIYNRKIAREVFGTDNPDEVQEFVKHWAAFFESAKKLKQKGYFMVSAADDTFRMFSNTATTKWVDENRVIRIPESLEEWTDVNKLMWEKGYVGKNVLWDEGWAQSTLGTSFCFFGPAWFIDFVLLENSLETKSSEGGIPEIGNGTFGEWGVCRGPQNFFWGGTWICAAKGTDNIDIIADIMRVMTCSSETATKLTYGCNEFANNSIAMKEISKDENFGAAFLSYQNFIKPMYDAVDYIDARHITAYDQGLNECYQYAMHKYFKGAMTKEIAIEYFYIRVNERYPELRRSYEKIE